jgi:hypothetical protein
MDALQGCYKNGTDGTRDRRYISAVYFFVRIMYFVNAAALLGYSVIAFHCLAGVLFSVFAILIAITQPYKSSIFNTINPVLILVVALFYFFAMGRRLSHSEDEIVHRLTGVMQFTACLIPFVYIIIVILIALKSKTPQQCCSYMLNQPFCKRLLGRRASNSEEPLPERMANPEECAALLHEPVSDDQDSDGPPDQDAPSFEQQFY